MCKDPARHAFLKALPKAEHHVHIEGTLTPDLLFTLTARNNITLPSTDPAYASPAALLARYDRFTSLDDFLHFYYIAMSALLHAHDFDDLAWTYFQTAAADGCAHAEISFDPQAHLERGVSLATILAGFASARERAERELGMSTTLICCFLRHLPADHALEFLDEPAFLDAVKGGVITGVGLDSSELGFPPELFTQVYAKAKGLGLRLTAHAGEEGPADNVMKALQVLGVERIDHGIRVADDPAAVAHVAAAGTMLTVCPLSNLKLRCVQDIAELPIPHFLDAGVRFSVNSDDPSYFGGFILANFCALEEAFGISNESWERICTHAIEGSWCLPARKEELLGSLRKVIGQAA